DPPNPLNAYGRSKLAGEQAIQRSGARYLILRTSWVYAPRGNNFFRTILRAAREGAELRVVEDQVGAPTFCRALARVTAEVAARALSDPSVMGIYHATCSGETSWFGFASEIVRLAGLRATIHPIASSQYPARALRPRNSRLLNSRLHRVFGTRLPE